MTKKDFLTNFKASQKKLFNSGFQNWWTEFLFHYNDLHNIVSILNSGSLYGRNKAKVLDLLKTDIANDDVISNTHIEVYDYARLYFGAKTPTLYHNEGLIPKNEIRHNAHCPVPVFLLFDFVKVLSIDDIYFSNGNVGASTPEIYNDINNLPRLEWNNIYHRDSLYGYDEGTKKHITYCRNAEVLVKDKLDIYDNLKWICVRSTADKETLLYLVSKETREKIKDKIKVFTQGGLFHNHRLYLKEVTLGSNRININFTNFNNKSFSIEAFAKSIADDKEKSGSVENYQIKQNLYWDLEDLNSSEGVYFIFRVDGHAIYENILFHSDEVLV